MRPADSRDATKLSDLAMRSKAYWGYSDKFMEACRSELTVDSHKMSEEDVEFIVAEQHGSVVGYYSLRKISPAVYELDALYVDAEHIDRGFGRKLLEHAIQGVRNIGVEELLIQSDPHATEFYTSAGAIRTGVRESGSIPGRYLPLLKLVIRSVD